MSNQIPGASPDPVPTAQRHLLSGADARAIDPGETGPFARHRAPRKVAWTAGVVVVVGRRTGGTAGVLTLFPPLGRRNGFAKVVQHSAALERLGVGAAPSSGAFISPPKAITIARSMEGIQKVRQGPRQPQKKQSTLFSKETERSLLCKVRRTIPFSHFPTNGRGQIGPSEPIALVASFANTPGEHTGLGLLSPAKRVHT